MVHYFPQNHAWDMTVLRLLDETRYGGGDINEIDRTARLLHEGDEESWLYQWRTLAEEVEALATTAEAAQHIATARDAYLRACNYYRMAEFFLPAADPRKPPLYQKVVSCFHQAGKHFSPPVERVEINFEEATMPGYYFPAPPGKEQSSPAVVFLGGADSMAEELYFLSVPLLQERGMACLIVDTPGRGGCLRLYGIPTRPDYEKPVGALLDFLQNRPDVDPERIGLLGVSMGGYYAPRAAAFDPRVKACVAWCGCYDVLEDIYEYFPPLRPQLQWIVGAQDEEEARERLGEFNLRDVAHNIRCPLLITHGAEDRIMSVAGAQRLYEEAQGPKRLKIWTAEEGGAAHCQWDGLTPALTFMLDWLADQL